MLSNEVGGSSMDIVGLSVLVGEAPGSKIDAVWLVLSTILSEVNWVGEFSVVGCRDELDKGPKLTLRIVGDAWF